MSVLPPPYPADNKQYPQPTQAGYPQQPYPQTGYAQPTAYPTAHVQYTTYPQAVYTTQPQTIIVDDCHHHHRHHHEEAGTAGNLCCLAAGLACLCALCINGETRSTVTVRTYEAVVPGSVALLTKIWLKRELDND
ncbi:hypothetical protein NECAME_05616 [Necator americanus]|uniref:Uncharacterized protein n=1 Tax=Necator americanus TaxID=51031 RepID=W2SFW7_NECAM|nr:hypothetical protein NECAME_05616 [Necator americanus]ETN68428.1 hypothetical protein NECAME_05616 [Necator americanus]